MNWSSWSKARGVADIPTTPTIHWTTLRSNRNRYAKVSRRWLCSVEHELLHADSRLALSQSCRRRLGESLHRTWCQHSRKRNVSLLNEDIGNCVSAVFTELLI